MENFFIIFFMAIVIISIAALSSASSQRKPNTHTKHDPTNGLDYNYYGSDDTHHLHYHGYTDHNSGFDFSSGDSGSCDSGGCDGGSGGGGCD